MCNIALLIIDMQNYCFTRERPVYEEDRLLDNILLLMDRARQCHSPVFIIQHTSGELQPEGSDAWQLHPRLLTAPEDVRIQKGVASAFRGTALAEELKKRGIRRIAVTGVASQWCVKATCVDAIKLGFEVILVADGHSNFQKDAQKVIRDVNRALVEKGAKVMGTEEVGGMFE